DATDTSARLQFAMPPTARQRPRPDAEIDGGVVSSSRDQGAQFGWPRGSSTNKIPQAQVDEKGGGAMSESRPSRHSGYVRLRAAFGVKQTLSPANCTVPIYE